MVENEYIEEFKTLYKKRFGVDLTDAEASFRANNLLNLYRAVLSPESKGIVNEARDEGRNTSHDEN